MLIYYVSPLIGQFGPEQLIHEHVFPNSSQMKQNKGFILLPITEWTRLFLFD